MGTGFCPIWGIWRGAGTPATSQMRCWLLPTGRIFPRCGGASLRWFGVLRLRFFALPARWRNVGFCTAAAHTLAGWAKSRTQRRHAPHGAHRALGTPTGSIVPIIFTGGKSALSARLSEIHRLPLLRYVSAKIPFSLRAATLSRTRRVIFFGVIPRLPSGSIFADSADGEPRYVGSARSNSEKRCTS